MKILAVLAGSLAVAACVTTPPPMAADATVRNIDELQRRMVAEGDVAGLEDLAHPDLAINAPGNRVLTRDQFLANMRSGEIRAEQFTRTPDRVHVTGNIAVVMGRETFTPASTRELGRTFGTTPLNRSTPTSIRGTAAVGVGWRATPTSSPGSGQAAVIA